MNIKTLLVAIAACAALPALAQTPADPTATPGIDARAANQERRIEQGQRSGALTPHEAAKLERGQAHVQKMEARAKSDGVVTAKERRHIRHAQNAQSRKIYRQKHDRQHDVNHDGMVDRPSAAAH
jgi:uncharacterized membrane protein YebE (DUF533 family)